MEVVRHHDVGVQFDLWPDLGRSKPFLFDDAAKIIQGKRRFEIGRIAIRPYVPEKTFAIFRAEGEEIGSFLGIIVVP
jgi:hypothetical protein